MTLSPRQRQVVVLASEGYGVKGTADLLGLSQNTVKAHRKAALRALGAGDMYEAVRLTLRERKVQSHRRPAQDTTLELV